MRIEGDDVIFSTGKVVYANCGIIGLSPRLNVTEGYDGGFYHPHDEWESGDDALTPEEAVELAEYMVEQWQKFKAEHQAK